MKRIEELFPSHNSNTDECVRISSIRTNPIDFGMNKFVNNGLSRSTQFSAKINNSVETPKLESIARPLNNAPVIAKIRPRQENMGGQIGTHRPRMEQVSYYTRPLGPSNAQQTYRVDTKNYATCYSEMDDDVGDDDVADTMALKNNLKAKILTQGKSNMLNKKMQQFNYEKNRSYAGSSPDITLLPGQTQDILLLNTFRDPSRLDTNFQGPKSFYTTDLKSPTPKDNSFDEINDMLDFSSEGDQPDTMDKTEKIPMKEYLEISQICEQDELKSPEGDFPTNRLFSRDNEDEDDNSDYVEILEHEDTDSIHYEKLRYNLIESIYVNKPVGIKTAKLLTLGDEKVSDGFALQMLQKAIFEHDVEAVGRITKKYPNIINLADSLGNTPLILTAKLAYKHTDYYQIMRCLISQGAYPKAKDTNGWSCLDEVVCQADVMLLSVLFDQLITLKKVTLMKQQEKLVKLLNLTPDFYLEMKWDFESSLIPFFSKLAPSDTFKIWKYRKYLRMDSTLAGFKKLSVKRRDMSLIFNPDILMPTNFKAAGALFSVNRSKSQYTNTLQDVDIEEKKFMMYDMLKAEPLQGSFDIRNCQWNEYKGMFGGVSTHKVNGWETKRFDFRLDMEYAIFKKSKTFFQDTYDNYQTKVTNAKALPPQEFSQKNAKAILTQLKLRNGLTSNPASHRGVKPSPRVPMQSNPNQLNQLGIEKINLDTFENAHVTEKKAEASIWLAKNFPMKFEALSPVIEFLSNGNNLLHKVESLLSRNEVKSLISENAFPVKIQVPVTMSIKANITITKYEVLKNPNVDQLFFIPNNYTYVDRKDAQKTLLRTKKRMILVNALT